MFLRNPANASSYFVDIWKESILSIILLINRPRGKESTEVRITQKMGGKKKLLPKIKRFPEERHTQTHGNLFDIF